MDNYQIENFTSINFHEGVANVTCKRKEMDSILVNGMIPGYICKDIREIVCSNYKIGD